MRLLFYVSKLYSLPVVQPLVKESAARNIQTALFVSEKVKKRLPEFLQNFRVFTELKDALTFDPDFVLCPGNFVDFRLPGIKVELFHGIGIEKPSHYRIRHFFDIYLTSGPLVTSRFRAMQNKYKYFDVHETGWAKIDHIVNYDTKDIKERYGLPADKKIILYAPTHSKTMESATDILPAVQSLMRSDEIWLYKPHEFMSLELRRNLQEKNLQLIDGYDITPYLHIADVLVSDTSSVVYEFMALDKPVVTLRTLSRPDKGIDIQSLDELREALDRSFTNPDEFSGQRKKQIQQVNPRLDGTISKRIIDYLATIDSSAPKWRKRKPFNLFRKMQILYHSRFRKGYMR